MSEPFVIEQKQADDSYKQLIPLGYINRNEFDNGDFKINQRGVSGTISTPGYFIDRWKLVSGTVTLTANGLTLNGTISQILPTAIGTSYSTSVGMYSGTATVTYDNNTATGTITSTGGIIKWVKLEIGEVSTPFIPRKPAEELMECMRYFQVLSSAQFVCLSYSTTAASVKASLFIPMRITPTLTLENNITSYSFSDSVASKACVSILTNYPSTTFAGMNISSTGLTQFQGYNFSGGRVFLSADL